MTTVVNMANGAEYDQYIGRSTPYGNPYHIGRDGPREVVVEKFRTHFAVRIQDLAFAALVEKLRDKRLGCHCAPKLCHGSVYVDYLEHGVVG